MKNNIVSFIILGLLALANPVFAQSSSVDSFEVKVDGLGCPYCAFGLEKSFKGLKGIKNIMIDMETGILTFEYPFEKKLSVEQVGKQVGNAGYTPVKVNIRRADGAVEEEVLKEESEG